MPRSGVLNATQQLAGAIGVAAIGSVLFGTLPRRPRDAQPAETGPVVTTAEEERKVPSRSAI